MSCGVGLRGLRLQRWQEISRRCKQSLRVLRNPVTPDSDDFVGRRATYTPGILRAVTASPSLNRATPPDVVTDHFCHGRRRRPLSTAQASGWAVYRCPVYILRETNVRLIGLDMYFFKKVKADRLRGGFCVKIPFPACNGVHSAGPYSFLRTRLSLEPLASF